MLKKQRTTQMQKMVILTRHQMEKQMLLLEMEKKHE